MANEFYPGQVDYIEKLNALWDLASAQAGGIVQTITANAPLVKSGTATAVILSMGAADAANNGYMTSAQAAKLAGLSNYTLPVATSGVLGGVKIGAGVLVTQDGTISVPGDFGQAGTVTSVQPAAGSNITITDQTTNPIVDIGLATQSIKGAMSPSDKAKLDSLYGSGSSPISAAPPAAPFPGQEWVDSTTGIKFTWYYDGISSAWIEL